MSIDRAAFFAAAAKAPGIKSASQVAGVNAILDAWEKYAPGRDLRWIAYSLATAYHETAATMQPIAEYGHGRGRPYGVPAGPYNQTYYGRGYVQLTWATNYSKSTELLRSHGVIGTDIDLEKSPDLAMRPDIAASVMIFGMISGMFTGASLEKYFNSTTEDAVNARRIINGTDQADKIADYYDSLCTALGMLSN